MPAKKPTATMSSARLRASRLRLAEAPSPTAHSPDGAAQRGLHGRLALVTGAGSGIGRAIAVALGAAGAEVVLAGRSAEHLAETADAMLQTGVRTHTQQVELTDDASVSELARVVDSHGDGRLAVLVHCAAQYQVARADQNAAETFDEIFNSNVRAPFLLTSKLLPALRQAGGDLVFINSSAALGARRELSAYAASKAALRMFADCVRAEVSSEGVRVLSVFPGRTATPMQERIYASEGRRYQPELLLQPEQVANATLAAIRLERNAELTELHIRPTSRK